MRKQYKSSIIKNHKITNKRICDGVSQIGYVARPGVDYIPM